MKMWIAVLAFVGSLFVMPEPVYAGNPVVMVDVRVGSQAGNVSYALRFVDRYTGSRFVQGKCRKGKRCVVVRLDKSRVKGTAYARWSGAGRAHVKITAHPGRGDSYMRRLWAHEIAHAMFVEHSSYRTNIMYPTLHKRNGKLVSFRFTNAQIRVLRNH